MTVIESLKKRYEKLHPLLLHRSVEHSKSNGDLFDILDTVPKKYPIIWCEENRRWIHIKDLYLSQGFFQENETV